MGFAIARRRRPKPAPWSRWLAGPTALPTPAQVRRIDVLTAAQMLEAVMTQARQSEVFVSVAAVADWRVDPKQPGQAEEDLGTARFAAGPQSRHPGSGGKPALTALLRRGLPAETEQVQDNARPSSAAKKVR